MDLQELIRIHPELKGVVKRILPAIPEDYQYNEIDIKDLLIEALDGDPEIDDKDDIFRIVEGFKWLEQPMITLFQTDAEWDETKKEVISRNKFLDTLFKKNKLRRSSMVRLEQWFMLYPSLFSGSQALQELWEEQRAKFMPSAKLKEQLLAQNPPIEVIGTPSQYDLYDLEAKQYFVDSLMKIVKKILVEYIHTHHPTFERKR